MPRTGGGTGPFVLNPVYLAVPGTTILATQHNTPLEDIEDTFNIPQPIAYGGTQGASAIEAMDNLFIVGADKASSASIDLDNVTGSFVNITGTTPVTSIALAEGAIRFARAVAALPITASASLIVNGSTTQAYTCEAGDQMMIVGYAGAIVRIWVTGRNKFIASQFKIADGTDQTKTARFLPGGPTATQRDYDLPYYSGTLGLVSDIRGQIYGLTLSNNVTDATNDIDIAAGSAVDTTGTTSMLLASSLTKRKDAAWAVGTNQGGMDTGSAPANGTLHVYEIRRPDTGVVDSCFSVSASAPTTGVNIPAAYTQYRRIGSLIVSGSSFLAFVQIGNDFILAAPVFDINATNPGTSAVLRTLSVPSGISVNARIIAAVINSGATGPTGLAISTPNLPDPGLSILLQVDGVSNATGRVIIGSAEVYVYTNTSSQIRSRLPFSDANVILRIQTMGWTDTRGAF